MIPVLDPVREWYCPKCKLRDRTHEARPHTRFHACRGLAGLTAPMLPVGVNAKTEAHEREDYVGQEDVPLTNGRPIMSVVTTRDDGQDTIVFAPTARARST